MAEEAGTDLLGGLPLDIRIRTGSDSGQPVMITEPEGTLASAYRDIANRIAREISSLESAAENGDADHTLPNIVME